MTYTDRRAASSLRAKLLRVYCAINRFGTLPAVERFLSGLPSGSLERRRLFGYEIEVDLSRSSAQRLIYVEGERFIDERRLVRSLLRPGDTAVDVGANVGYYALLIERAIGSAGKLICIEPSEENLPELERNLAINRFENAIVHAVALGSSDGVVEIRRGINSGVTCDGGGAYRVPIRRLDTLLNERVDFIKIDVEGYEGHVVDGAGALLERDRPRIFLEMHPELLPRYGRSVRSVLAPLRALYGRIGFHVKGDVPGNPLIRRLAARYLGWRPIDTVLDQDAYVLECDNGRLTETFWVTCER